MKNTPETIGTCSLEDAMTVDDVLLGPAMRNPRAPGTMVLDWPSKPVCRHDPRSGRTYKYRKYPAGPIFEATKHGVPVRIKIYVGLGMIAIDRALGTTCTWRTPFCTRYCYNKTLMQVRPGIKQSGPADEAFWAALTGEWLYDLLHSERFAAFSERMGYTPAWMRGRMRLATRGEAFSQSEDVPKIADLMKCNPATLFWVTTRAWVNGTMANLIEDMVLDLPNARVLASLDPSHSEADFRRAEKLGWNTIFFGDDTFTEGRYLCPKTWKRKKSYCRLCRNGCFKDGPVDVHLAVHGTKVEERELEEFRAR